MPGYYTIIRGSVKIETIDKKIGNTVIVKSLFDSAIIEKEQMEKYICTTTEDSDLLYFNKKVVLQIQEEAIENDPTFLDRYNCIKKIDIFQDL